MYFWWEVNFIFKYLIKFQSVRYFRKHICHIWASTSASFITCVSQANRYHDVLQRSLCLSDFQISHKSKICEILQWKSATFASFNFLSPDILMSLKDLSDGKTGQLVVAIAVKEVKPGVIIISEGKTSGAVLVAEDPDRKYTKGGRGSKSSNLKFCKWIPWCSVGTLFFQDCAWKRYFTKTTISHGCRFREI